MDVGGMPETATVGCVTETAIDHSTSFLSPCFYVLRALRPPMMMMMMMMMMMVVVVIAKNAMEGLIATECDEEA